MMRSASAGVGTPPLELLILAMPLMPTKALWTHTSRASTNGAIAASVPARGTVLYRVLDERQRLAREIHDTLAQGLVGMVTQLEAADQARDRSAERDRHLGTAAELARTSLAEARRSVHALRPEALDGVQLPEALAEAARRFGHSGSDPGALCTCPPPPRPTRWPSRRARLTNATHGQRRHRPGGAGTGATR